MSEFSILLALAVAAAAGFIVTRFDPSRGHAHPTNRLLMRPRCCWSAPR